ncbi:hypothetical protein, partial [Kingella denitrificans]|uniref:hypothetical protein n=1 Tax=Kingella denitrificans TaxID=502 RepID=UPI0028D20D67
IMRESKSERRQQIQRQSMAYRRHIHSWMSLTTKWAIVPKSPPPSPLPQEREQVATGPKVRRISRIAQHIKSSLYPTHAPNLKKQPAH